MRATAVATAHFVRRHPAAHAPRRRSPPPVDVRWATADDARAIHTLVGEHVIEGHLLPRTLDDVTAHAARFIVAVDGRRVVACADLAPLNGTSAEIRSLVVADGFRARGIGRRLLEGLKDRATIAGFDRVCAFTHSPSYFLKFGFSIVPHAWVPEKIAADCRSCAQFRQCGQYAVMLPLVRSRSACVPLAALHG